MWTDVCALMLLLNYQIIHFSCVVLNFDIWSSVFIINNSPTNKLRDERLCLGQNVALNTWFVRALSRLKCVQDSLVVVKFLFNNCVVCLIMYCDYKFLFKFCTICFINALIFLCSQGYN